MPGLTKKYKLIDTILLSDESIADKVFSALVSGGFAVMKSSQMVDGLGYRIGLDVMKQLHNMKNQPSPTKEASPVFGGDTVVVELNTKGGHPKREYRYGPRSSRGLGVTFKIAAGADEKLITKWRMSLKDSWYSN